VTPSNAATPYGIDHVAIVVRSIDQSLPYYRNVLRLDVTHEEYVADAGVRLLHLTGSNSSSTCTLQLVEPISDGPVRAHLDSHGEGLHHVCLAVPDLAAYVDLIPNGTDRRFLGGRGRPACFLRERPNHALIEVIECALQPAAELLSVPEGT
jgi:methylmalonyl-CoA/ethylmalonyl-CoA epimerase